MCSSAVLLPFLVLLPISRLPCLRLANTASQSHCGSDFPGTLGTHPRERQSQEEAKAARSPGGEAGDDRVWKAPRNLRIQLRSSARGTLRYGVGGKACTGSPSERHPWDLSGLSPPPRPTLSPLDVACGLLVTWTGGPRSSPFMLRMCL